MCSLDILSVLNFLTLTNSQYIYISSYWLFCLNKNTVYVYRVQCWYNTMDKSFNKYHWYIDRDKQFFLSRSSFSFDY